MTGVIEIAIWTQERSEDDFLVPAELEVEFSYDAQGYYHIDKYLLFDKEIRLESLRNHNNIDHILKMVDYRIDHYVYNEKED